MTDGHKNGCLFDLIAAGARRKVYIIILLFTFPLPVRFPGRVWQPR